MEYKKLTDTSIEVTTPVVKTFEYKELLAKKRQIKAEKDFETSRLQAQIAIYNAQIDEINILLEECTKLNVVEEAKIIIEDGKLE
jgi:hypothetical protein